MIPKNDSNFEEKLTFCLQNNIRNSVNFNPSSGKSKNLYFDGLLLESVYVESIYVMFELKNKEGLCREKWLMVSKMT